MRDQLIAALIENEDWVGMPPGLVWLARLAGIIHLSAQDDVTDLATTLLRRSTYGERVDLNGLQEAATAVSDAFFDLMPEFSFDIPEALLSDTPGPQKLVCIHRVARNRRVELAVNKSAAAIKADAARRLFGISCRHITWAVIDSGIDTEHRAFVDHTDGTVTDKSDGSDLAQGRELR